MLSNWKINNFQRMQTRITSTGNRIPFVFSMAACSFFKDDSLPDNRSLLALTFKNTMGFIKTKQRTRFAVDDQFPGS
ncbi:hypothetical protein SAMN06295970_1323 [Noviherbaspirillum suwonense]|uniref:Uncharacterized protein n=1 Tax=Noviherbaspirillum suwonense TaxID=1224511 RepID=A0ABY1QT46_9BURK|nr:hypothetical protein SAMN06295970_1323 [Noviherbaspirillum suwonense]